jgi:hypothetical protein
MNGVSETSDLQSAPSGGPILPEPTTRHAWALFFAPMPGQDPYP